MRWSDKMLINGCLSNTDNQLNVCSLFTLVTFPAGFVDERMLMSINWLTHTQILFLSMPPLGTDITLVALADILTLCDVIQQVLFRMLLIRFSSIKLSTGRLSGVRAGGLLGLLVFGMVENQTYFCFCSLFFWFFMSVNCCWWINRTVYTTKWNQTKLL